MSVSNQDPFQSIRPYNDDEVAQVVSNLITTPELIDALAQFRFPRLSKLLPGPVRWMVKRVLSAQLGKIDSVEKMQQLVASYMQKMIDRSTQSVTYSGLDELDPDGAYLFISNHRDIAMDPAFVNWGLYQRNMKTLRIAIGDNLLRKPYVSDLMRLNKSFIVKRSAKGIREKMAALTQLSGYISHSLDTGNAIWIAQREGRAKDGNDKTDPAIIKMLFMGRKKQGMAFPEAIKSLKIVPVAISYEYDPCDRHKARELYERASTGEYHKSEYEDIDSIVYGITGDKGDVHVAFGQPIDAELDTPEQVAEAIDKQILSNYHLHSSNLLAAKTGNVAPDKQQAFEARLQSIPEAHREQFLQMYAYPVTNKPQQA